MAKVFGMHMVGLRPGIKGEDFEKFFHEKVIPLPHFPGDKVYLLKGDRGDREGRYLLMLEFESIEIRDRFNPTPDQPSDEALRFIKAHKDAIFPVLAEWEKLASGIGAPTIYTDYVVVSETG